MNLQKLITDGYDTLRSIFDRNGLKNVPLTERNLSNAISVMPNVKAEIINSFNSYEGFDKKINKEKFIKTATDTVAAIKAVKAAKQAKEELPIKEEKKVEIFGLNPYLFWSIVTIILLVIILIAVKTLK